MSPTSDLRIVQMEDRHLREVFSMIDRENWGWEFDEVRRIHALDPRTSAVAYDGDRLVGLVTGINYGTLAFIVHVIVREGWRGRNVGRRMMGSVLADLDASGVSDVELHANPEAVEFYSQFGFARVEDISFLSNSAPHASAGDGHAVEGRFSWLTPQGMGLVPGLLAGAMGGTADEIGAALIRDPVHHALARIEDGEATAALLSRAGHALNSMGPWVMDDPSLDEASAMMRVMLSSVPDKRVDVCAPGANGLALSALEACGFSTVKAGIVRLSRSSGRVEPFPRSLLAVGHQGLI